MTRTQTFILFLVPVAVSFLLHLHVFRLDVMGYHSWRQTQTQTVIYHFSNTDNSIFHPQRFDISSGSSKLMYEFPVYQWLIAAVNRQTGYSVINTRVCSFLFFIFLLAGFYRLLRIFFSRKFALTGNFLLCFSPLMYYYCVNPLPDTLALGFAIWALYFFFTFEKRYSFWPTLGFGIALSLSALIKLPYILFGSVIIIYWLRKLKERSYRPVIQTVLLVIMLFIPVLLWYLKAIATWNTNPVVSGILNNNKSLLTLLDYFQFTLISSVPELLTNYAACILLLTGIFLFFKRMRRPQALRAYFVMLFSALSAYFLYEINLIEKTHDYYLMPFVPLIFILVTYGAGWFYANKKATVVLIVICVAPLTAWLRINGRWDPEHPGFQKDYLTEQVTLQRILPENAVCIIDHDGSGFIALYYLKRFGYSLSEGQMNPQLLKDLYNKGGRYLVTESKGFDPESYPAMGFHLLFSKNVNVYQLEPK